MTAPRAYEEETVAHGAYLPYSATTEARAELVKYLQKWAPEKATGSRDFGRGYMQAVRDLAAAPVRCACCDLRAPYVAQGDTHACKDCGSLWRRSGGGWTWVGGGAPVVLEVE